MLLMLRRGLLNKQDVYWQPGVKKLQRKLRDQRVQQVGLEDRRALPILD